MRKRLCIIAFSPVQRDARVLRQIEYLSPHYDVTVISHGEPVVAFPGVTWNDVPMAGKLDRALTILLLLAAKLIPALYDRWYWQKRRNQLALQYAIASRADAIHANDWSALPVAVEAARKTGARVVVDLHEYAPRQSAFGWWVWLFAPMVTYFLKRDLPAASATMTVCQPIAGEYRREFNIDPLVVLNAPNSAPLAHDHPLDPDCIQLVHHGIASRERRLEVMIEAVGLAGPRFRLHMMLVGNPRYVRELRALAQRVAPGQVEFHPPVPPADIVETIARYDIGFCVLAPTTYNILYSLPNKFFDFVMAGLAVCIGPSPSMAQLIEQYHFGIVASGFGAAEVARSLQNLTLDDIARLRAAARAAAPHLSADHEMAKVVQLYEGLLEAGG